MDVCRGLDPATTIRGERPGDSPTVADVVRRAYADVAHSDHREYLMVERLRATDAFLPELSLIAEVDGEAVGHVLLTKASIHAGRSVRSALALAPLSVVPGFQRRGVGRRLIGSAHSRAAALGHTIILVVGLPGFYRRFGYERLGRHPIALPFDVPDEAGSILALASGALDGVAGTVRYARGWLDH